MGVTRLTTANWSCVPYCRIDWPQIQPIALLADTSCNLFTRTGICRNSKHRDRLLAKVDHPSRVAQWFQSHLHLCWQQRPLASSKSLANQGRGSPDTVLKTEFGKIPRIPFLFPSGRQGDWLVPHSFKICKCDKSVTWPGILVSQEEIKVDSAATVKICWGAYDGGRQQYYGEAGVARPLGVWGGRLYRNPETFQLSSPNGRLQLVEMVELPSDTHILYIYLRKFGLRNFQYTNDIAQSSNRSR